MKFFVDTADVAEIKDRASTGLIDADDTSIVKKVSVEYKGIDKTNPRIEVNLIYDL